MIGFIANEEYVAKIIDGLDSLSKLLPEWDIDDGEAVSATAIVHFNRALTSGEVAALEDTLDLVWALVSEADIAGLIDGSLGILDILERPGPGHRGKGPVTKMPDGRYRLRGH